MKNGQLTPHMLGRLKECYQLTKNHIPCHISHFNYCLTALVTREMIKIVEQNVEGRLIATAVLTEKAIKLFSEHPYKQSIL